MRVVLHGGEGHEGLFEGAVARGVSFGGFAQSPRWGDIGEIAVFWQFCGLLSTGRCRMVWV